MKKVLEISLAAMCMLAALAAAQTKDAYNTTPEKSSSSLLDPSRFQIHHALSFGMASSNGSSLKSQSLYSTMIQYQFAKPVTLNLNFNLPIHSTFNSARNFTPDNLQSGDYFRNMPFAAALTWQPRENLMMRLSVTRQTVQDYMDAYYFGRYRDPFHSDMLMPW